MSVHQAWRSWLEIHGSHLMLYARQLSRCEADAEDVVQNALVKTWRHLADSDLPTRDTPEAHRGLIFTNIRRCAIDLGRSLQRRQRRDRRLGADLASEGVQASWFELPQDDEVRQLQVALAAIPMKFREVITLKIWAELTFAEISETLGLSPNTAASRYRYGLEALRNRLGSSVCQRPPGEPES
jgi:RNA polymerase sigma-70 factor (ECF subfamily)